MRDGGGRLFILGVGGGAGHASHAVNDFRKIAHLESYTPTDNVSELTARINDDGWESAYAAYLKGSRINAKDAVLIFSVGGGSREHNVSTNLVAALDLAREVGARIYGIVGKADGETAQGRRRLRRRAGPGGAPHAAGRGLPGRRLAPRRLPSPAGRAGRQVGIARMTAAVFVDRDGVINEPVWDQRTQSYESPYRPEDVALVPGAAQALADLTAFTARAGLQPTERGQGPDDARAAGRGA